MIRWTANERTSSVRGSYADSQPASTRTGSTMRSTACRGCPRSRSRPAAGLDGLVEQRQGARPAWPGRGRSRGAGRLRAARSPARIARDRGRDPGGRGRPDGSRGRWAVPAARGAGRAGPRAGPAGPCRRLPRRPGPSPARAAGGAGRRPGYVADHDGGRDPAQPQRLGPRVVHQLGEGGLVVAAQEGLRRPDPDGAEAAGDVVDEVGERLRHRGPRRAEAMKACTSAADQPESKARRTERLGEPVDGRPAARLDVGDHGEVPAPGPARAGPGATAVRSAWSSTWSTGAGSSGASAARARGAAGSSARGSARPWVDTPPSPVTPTTADSSTAQPTAGERTAGRRGRSHAIRSTRDATPVPAASTGARARARPARPARSAGSPAARPARGRGSRR